MRMLDPPTVTRYHRHRIWRIRILQRWWWMMIDEMRSCRMFGRPQEAIRPVLRTCTVPMSSPVHHKLIRVIQPRLGIGMLLRTANSKHRLLLSIRWIGGRILVPYTFLCNLTSTVPTVALLRPRRMQRHGKLRLLLRLFLLHSMELVLFPRDLRRVTNNGTPSLVPTDQLHLREVCLQKRAEGRAGWTCGHSKEGG